MRALFMFLLLPRLALAAPTHLEMQRAEQLPLKFVLVGQGDRHYAMLVNGLPVTPSSVASDTSAVYAVVDASWLHVGENTIELQFSEPAPVKPTTSVLSLHYLPARAKPEALEQARLWTWTVPQKGTPQAVFVLPDNGWPIGQLLAKAKVVKSLTDADKVELAKLTHDRFAAFRAGDKKALLRSEAFRIDVATAAGVDERQRELDLLELVTKQRGQLKDLVLDDPTTYELVGGGRVAIIHNQIHGATMFTTWAARIGERWVAVSDGQ